MENSCSHYPFLFLEAKRQAKHKIVNKGSVVPKEKTDPEARDAAGIRAEGQHKNQHQKGKAVFLPALPRLLRDAGVIGHFGYSSISHTRCICLLGSPSLPPYTCLPPGFKIQLRKETSPVFIKFPKQVKTKKPIAPSTRSCSIQRI